MVFEKIWKNKTNSGDETKEPESEWVELDTASFDEKRDISVRVESLKDFADTDRIQQMLREGVIVFLRIKDFRQKDLTELKRAIDKLKKTCVAIDGDIVGVDEDFLVLTPNFARIWRGQ